MAGTKVGATKVAAGKLGVTVTEYLARKEAGFRWCWCCRTWKLAGLFPRSSGPKGAVSGQCLECSRVKVRKNTKGRPGSMRGRRHTAAARHNMSLAHQGSRNHRWKGGTSPLPEQDREKLLGRRAINHAVEAGRLAPPGQLPCIHCGGQAQEYHHHRGYAPCHELDVQALCIKCHRHIHLV